MDSSNNELFISLLRKERENTARRLQAIDTLIDNLLELPEQKKKEVRGSIIRKKYKKRIVKNSVLPSPDGRKKKRRCTNCGTPGHRPVNCPKLSSGGKFEVPDEDDEEEPVRPTTNREEVQALKDQGMDSLRVAAQLKVSLSEVNKYW